MKKGIALGGTLLLLGGSFISPPALLALAQEAPAAVSGVDVVGVEQDQESNTTITVYFKLSPGAPSGTPLQFQLVYPTTDGAGFPVFNRQEVLGTDLSDDGTVYGTIDRTGKITLNGAVDTLSDPVTVSAQFTGVPNSATLMGKEVFQLDAHGMINGVLSEKGGRVSFPTANTDPFGGSYGVIHSDDPSLIDIYTNPTEGLEATVINMQVTVPHGMTVDVESNQGHYQSGVVSDVTGSQSSQDDSVYFIQEAVQYQAMDVSQFNPKDRRLESVLSKTGELESNQHVERVFIGTVKVEDQSLVNGSVLTEPIAVVSPAGSVSITALYTEDQVPDDSVKESVDEEGNEESDGSDVSEESMDWEDTQDETANAVPDPISEEEKEGAVEVPFAIEEKESLDLKAGERKTIRQGRNGYTKDGDTLQEAINQIDEVGVERTIDPYDTTRRANPALSPGDEVVVDKGQYGLVPKDDRSRLDPVPRRDELIEFSPVGENGVTLTAYSTKRQPNDQMMEGQERVVEEGAYGEVDAEGQEILPPKDEVIEYGTKVIIEDVLIPYGTTRTPNPDLPAGVEQVVTEGQNGTRQGTAVIREPVQQVVEFGPSNSSVQDVAPVAHKVIYQPVPFEDVEHIGKTRTVQEGKVGSKTYTGETVEEAQDQVLEYPVSGMAPGNYVPFKTIYQPNADLKPGEQAVVTVGVYGRQNASGTVTSEAIDQVIDYGPNTDGSVPNLNDLKNPYDIQSPFYRVRQQQEKSNGPVQDSNGMLMPELPGGTMTPDSLELAVYDLYQAQGNQRRGVNPLVLVVGFVVVLLGIGGGLWIYHKKVGLPEDFPRSLWSNFKKSDILKQKKTKGDQG